MKLLFDWFMKTHTLKELAQRCDTLIKILENEQEEEDEHRKKHKGKAGDGEPKSPIKLKNGAQRSNMP